MELATQRAGGNETGINSSYMTFVCDFITEKLVRAK